ncbi:hypothetical protein YPPY07_0552, partial [Yersinia pestis PY-07]
MLPAVHAQLCGQLALF